MNTTSIKLSVSIWVFTSFLAMGTPDREVKVEEKLLGSNADGFISIRTLNDNHGSYYSSSTKRFLVEYGKMQADLKYESSIGSEIKSELLLEMTTSYDANFSGQHFEDSKSIKVNTKNEKIILADLLVRFPDQLYKWEAKELAALKCQSEAGIYIGHFCIVWGGWIKEKFCGDPNVKLEWKLIEVFEDANCLYLSVSTEEYGQRIVSVPPRNTKLVRDQIKKQPVYLIAGKYNSSDEAVEMGQKLMEKTKGKFASEVWSYKSPEDKKIYALADSESAEHLKSNQYESLETMAGIHFTAMSSELFEECWPVKPLK